MCLKINKYILQKSLVSTTIHLIKRFNAQTLTLSERNKNHITQ